MTVKRPGCDAELLRPVVEVKKAWSCICTPPYTFMTWCFYRDTGNFINMLIAWRHRSPSWRLSLYLRISLSPSVGLCYIARNDCSDSVHETVLPSCLLSGF